MYGQIRGFQDPEKAMKNRKEQAVLDVYSGPNGAGRGAIGIFHKIVRTGGPFGNK